MKKGFTLIELLVVISIIGILISLGAVSFTTAQKKSRDTRRKSDMKQIQTALEQCYSLQASYPIAVWNTGALTCNTQTIASVFLMIQKTLVVIQAIMNINIIGRFFQRLLSPATRQ